MPRVKPIYPVYRVADTAFRIGAQFGITAEIEDAEGQMWALVQLLDGRHDVPSIATAMRKRFPALSDEDVRDGIRSLEELNFLEHTETSAYGEERTGELSRYCGNINYFSHFTRIDESPSALQDRLRHTTVVLLGLGGGGSNILPLLAASGVGHIVAVDYDQVELTNLNRQCLFREADVGELKTAAAARVIADMNSTTRLETVTMKIGSSEDVQSVIKGADLVVCAIDEPPFLAQRRVNHACMLEDIPCLYGLSMVTSGRMFSVIPHQSGCVDCLNLYYSRNDPLFVEQFKGFMESGFVGPTVAFAPHIVRLSGLIAAEAVRLLTGYAAPRSIGRQVEFDFESGEMTTLTSWSRDPECPTCGCGSAAEWPIFALYPGAVSRHEG
jgi:molybdopterin/thiamine biosynthesis adenylyltransferase